MAIAVFQWRYFNFPIDYADIRTPKANFLFIVPELAELAFPFVFWFVAKKNRKQEGEKK